MDICWGQGGKEIATLALVEFLLWLFEFYVWHGPTVCGGGLTTTHHMNGSPDAALGCHCIGTEVFWDHHNWFMDTTYKCVWLLVGTSDDVEWCWCTFDCSFQFFCCWPMLMLLLRLLPPELLLLAIDIGCDSDVDVGGYCFGWQ